MKKCNTLSELISKNGKDKEQYIEERYHDYLNEIVNANITFKGKRVEVRTTENHDIYRESFEHMITRDSNVVRGTMRLFDYSRIERLLWIRDILRNFKCSHKKCEGIYNWIQKRKNRKYEMIYCTKEKYLIVLEERKDYYLLISAHIVINQKKHWSLINEYKDYIDV